MKKTIAITLALLLCAVAFASCTQQTVTNVNVKIVGYQNEVIYDGPVTIVGNNPTVASALYALEANEAFTSLEMTETALKAINGTAEGLDATGEYYFMWTYSLNGVSENTTVMVGDEESSVLTGLTLQPVANNDTILFEYTYIAVSDLEG